MYVVESRFKDFPNDPWDICDEQETKEAGLRSLHFYQTCCKLYYVYRLVERDGDKVVVIAE